MIEEPEDRHPEDADEDKLVKQECARRQRAREVMARTEPTARDDTVEVIEEDGVRRTVVDVQKRLAGQAVRRAASAAWDEAYRRHPDDGADYGDYHYVEEPHLPLLAGPPLWRTLFAYPSDEDIDAAAQDALAVLKQRPKAEPPRITAMQIYDHHVARGDSTLPPLRLELLGRAMHINERHIAGMQRRAAALRGIKAGKTQQEIATEVGYSDARSVRDARDRPVPDDVALFAKVAEGTDLRTLRPAVAAALGLLEKDQWRTDVLAAIHSGVRKTDTFRATAREEAKRRWNGNVANDAKHIARAVEGTDARQVRRWIAHPEWEEAVNDSLTWLRREDAEAFQAAARVEARRRLRVEHNEMRLAAVTNDSRAIATARSASTGRVVDARTIRDFINRDGWENAVRENMDRLR